MNYYEELAVAQDASLEEIHHAYRALARLLHPDNQADPKLKSAAERQMIRLNEILATLADAEKRHKYDESLCTKLVVAEATLPPPIRRPPRPWPWIFAASILAGVGLWYMRSNESGYTSAERGAARITGRSMQPAQTVAPESAHPTSGSRPFKKVLRPKPLSTPEEFHAEENSARGEPVTQLPASREPVAAEQDEVRPTPEVHVEPPPPAPETAAQSQRAVQTGGTAFTGRWLYAPGARDPRTPGMYPPEFIELFLSEEQGVLSGRYWARYRIPDKPVSPEVRFRVTGAAQKGNATTVKWVSEDGASGQLKMVLRDSDSMEVTWWTTVFGQQTALTSGTAVLVRLQAR
ncbi:MAG: J domain-containing protein [Bryobacteraceae bacterium]|jgi:curved DNA-binding protein CbpA